MNVKKYLFVKKNLRSTVEKKIIMWYNNYSGFKEVLKEETDVEKTTAEILKDAEKLQRLHQRLKS